MREPLVIHRPQLAIDRCDMRHYGDGMRLSLDVDAIENILGRTSSRGDFERNEDEGLAEIGKMINTLEKGMPAS